MSISLIKIVHMTPEELTKIQETIALQIETSFGASGLKELQKDFAEHVKHDMTHDFLVDGKLADIQKKHTEMEPILEKIQKGADWVSVSVYFLMVGATIAGIVTLFVEVFKKK